DAFEFAPVPRGHFAFAPWAERRFLRHGALHGGRRHTTAARGKHHRPGVRSDLEQERRAIAGRRVDPDDGSGIVRFSKHVRRAATIAVSNRPKHRLYRYADYGLARRIDDL